MRASVLALVVAGCGGDGSADGDADTDSDTEDSDMPEDCYPAEAEPCDVDQGDYAEHRFDAWTACDPWPGDPPVCLWTRCTCDWPAVEAHPVVTCDSPWQESVGECPL